MRFGDTLSDDQFEGFTFDYCISNPPFGIDWKREQKKVEEEAARGEQGRFAPGLPKISDGQQLFVLNGFPNLHRMGKWQLYKMVLRYFQEMPEAVRQRLEDIFWKMTGWIVSCSFLWICS